MPGIEPAPGLRAVPNRPTVRFDDIMDALRTLDKQVNGDKYRRVLRRTRIFRKNGSTGHMGSGTTKFSDSSATGEGVWGY